MTLRQTFFSPASFQQYQFVFVKVLLYVWRGRTDFKIFSSCINIVSWALRLSKEKAREQKYSCYESLFCFFWKRKKRTQYDTLSIFWSYLPLSLGKFFFSNSPAPFELFVSFLSPKQQSSEKIQKRLFTIDNNTCHHMHLSAWYIRNVSTYTRWFF